MKKILFFVFFFSSICAAFNDCYVPNLDYEIGDTLWPTDYIDNFTALRDSLNNLYDSLDNKFIRYNSVKDSTFQKINVDTIRGNPDVDSLSGLSIIFSGKIHVSDTISISTVSPLSPLDVSYGSGAGVQIMIGADYSGTTDRTNNNNKGGSIGIPHYSNSSQEPISLIYGYAGSSDNAVFIGGGRLGCNSATELDFYSAANTTTLSGTRIVQMKLAETEFYHNIDMQDNDISAVNRIDSDTSGITYAAITKALIDSIENAVRSDSGLFSYIGVRTQNIDAPIDVSQSTLSILIGADYPSASTRTDATTKAGAIALPHYTNSEEKVCLVYGLSESSGNTVDIGGGSSTFNAATAIRFYVASDGTTTGGTETMSIEGNTGKVTFACNIDMNDTNIVDVNKIDSDSLIASEALILPATTAPATAGATGTAGEIRYDSDYIYICIGTDTWKRVAISTW